MHAANCNACGPVGLRALSIPLCVYVLLYCIVVLYCCIVLLYCFYYARISFCVLVSA